MKKNKVSIVEYENPIESVANSVELCGGNIMLSKASKVFIKPNVVFWTRHTPCP